MNKIVQVSVLVGLRCWCRSKKQLSNDKQLQAAVNAGKKTLLAMIENIREFTLNRMAKKGLFKMMILT